jgi:hypothetical protein
MPDQSTESFRVFLLQYGYSPEDLGPAIVQLPDGSSLPCPSNRAALQDLLEDASARLALGEYASLLTLTKRRQHFRWRWAHALEFARLSLTLSRDSISGPELDSSNRHRDVPIKDLILEASLIKRIGTVPKSMTPPVLRVLLNDQVAYVTLDTGAAISVMNETTFKEYFPAVSLQPTMIQAPQGLWSSNCSSRANDCRLDHLSSDPPSPDPRSFSYP